MKGQNEFVYFLVGGLVLLAILMVFFGTVIYKNPNGSNGQPGIIEAVKTFNVPDFSAANILERKETQAVSKRIYNGLLFGEDKVIYHINKADLQDVMIRFTVRETNSLGRLNIMANGKIVQSDYFQPGDYEITLPASQISESMDIQISSESSYWKIWAPTLYYIENVKIEFASYFQDNAQFKFYLGEEYMNMKFAKIDLVLDENIGSLIVDINGRTVWDSPIGNMQSITLDKTSLRLGDNIVTFRSDKDSKIEGHGTIAVIFLTRFPETINQSGIVRAKQPLVGQESQLYG